MGTVYVIINIRILWCDIFADQDVQNAYIETLMKIYLCDDENSMILTKRRLAVRGYGYSV